MLLLLVVLVLLVLMMLLVRRGSHNIEGYSCKLIKKSRVFPSFSPVCVPVRASPRPCRASVL